MATSSTSLANPQIPQLNGWAIKMKALFSSQDIWDLVENGFQEQMQQHTIPYLNHKDIC